MYISGKKQEEEIKTIKPRTIEVNLSDADVKRISEAAWAHGLTVGELIENFIGDLVCGTYSNGSDERMYAQQWFDRCGFGMFQDTFLKHLLENEELIEVVEAWKDIEDSQEAIREGCTSIQEEQKCIEECRAVIDDYWNEYVSVKGKNCRTFEEEMRKVLDYWQGYLDFLG